MTVLLVCLISMAAVLGSPSPKGDEAGARTAQQAVLRLDTGEMERQALQEELALHLQGVEVQTYTAGDDLGPRQLYARVQFEDTVVMTVITADGRAFDRTVDPGDDPPVRVAAASLSNLVFAILDGRVTADRSGVAVEKTPATDAREDAGPAAPAEAEAETDAAAAEASPDVSPRSRLLVEIPLGVMVGPGRPTGADVFAGWHGGVRLAGQLAQGARVVGGLGITGRQARGGGASLGIVRFRIQVGAGYGRTWERLDAAVDVTAFAEPFLVTRSGRPAPLRRDGQRQRLVLVGGEVRAIAAYRLSASSRTPAIAVGPFVALSGALALGDTPTVPVILDDQSTPTFRPGAFELTTGVGTVLSF